MFLKIKTPSSLQIPVLTFNWGGVSDKVQTTMTLLKSRSHNEKVVEYLQYYVDYKKKAKYWSYDAYKKVPYLAVIDTSKTQLVGKEITITPISINEFEMEVDINLPTVRMYHYGIKKYSTQNVSQGVFKQKFKVNEQIELPYLSMKLIPYLEAPFSNEPFTIILSDFNGKVSQHRGIGIVNNKNSPAILNLAKTGTNKNKIIDYLNASVKVLSRDQLKRKNLFATKTIKFVDSMLLGLEKRVKLNEDELNAFKKKSKSLDLVAEGAKLSSDLAGLDIEKDLINKKLDYLFVLEDYLIKSKDFKNVPAPSVTGVDEMNIVTNVGKIISLSIERSQYEYSLKEGAPKFFELDRNINSLKRVLLENIKAYRNALGIELKSINRRLGKIQSEFSSLPERSTTIY